MQRVHSDIKIKNQAEKKKSTVEKEVIPQPVSPMMRVTRFCWILSTIFFLIDMTGRWEKLDCNNEGVGEGGGEDGDEGGCDAILRNRHRYCCRYRYRYRDSVCVLFLLVKKASD
jgi:hypothetical protein